MAGGLNELLGRVLLLDAMNRIRAVAIGKELWRVVRHLILSQTATGAYSPSLYPKSIVASECESRSDWYYCAILADLGLNHAQRLWVEPDSDHGTAAREQQESNGNMH